MNIRCQEGSGFCFQCWKPQNFKMFKLFSSLHCRHVHVQHEGRHCLKAVLRLSHLFEKKVKGSRRLRMRAGNGRPETRDGGWPATRDGRWPATNDGRHGTPFSLGLRMFFKDILTSERGKRKRNYCLTFMLLLTALWRIVLTTKWRIFPTTSINIKPTVIAVTLQVTTPINRNSCCPVWHERSWTRTIDTKLKGA